MKTVNTSESLFLIASKTYLSQIYSEHTYRKSHLSQTWELYCQASGKKRQNKYILECPFVFLDLSRVVRRANVCKHRTAPDRWSDFNLPL